MLRIRDPEPFSPRSGIRDRFFPDPGSRTHIFGSLVTIFWIKSSIIIWKLAQIYFFISSKIKIIFNLVKFVATKKGMTSNFFFIPLLCCCFWIRDPEWVKFRIQDTHPGSATLVESQGNSSEKEHSRKGGRAVSYFLIHKRRGTLCQNICWCGSTSLGRVIGLIDPVL